MPNPLIGDSTSRRTTVEPDVEKKRAKDAAPGSAAKKPPGPPRAPAAAVKARAHPPTGFEKAGAPTGPHRSSAGQDVSRIQQAQTELVNARKEVEDRDRDLAQQLSDIAPGLTNDQQNAYVRAFRKDTSTPAGPSNAEVYGQVDKKVDALAHAFQANKEAMLAAASTGDPKAVKLLATTLKDLAGSSHAGVVFDLLAEAGKHPRSVQARAVTALPNLQELAGSAIPNEAAELLKLHHGNANDARKALADKMTALEPIFRGKEGHSVLFDGAEAMEFVTEKGNYDRLKHLCEAGREASPLARGCASAGLIFGAANATLAANQHEYVQAVSAFANAGRSGAEILAIATQGLANSAKAAGELAKASGDVATASREFAAAAKLGKGATMLARLAPGLGLLASGTALALRTQALTGRKSDAGQAIGWVGDAVSVMGSAIECIPLGAPAGLAINGAGSLISVLGDGVSAAIRDGAYRAEKTRLLKDAGVPEPYARVFGNGDGNSINDLKNLRGLDAHQIQGLVKEFPGLVSPYEKDGLARGQFGSLMHLAGDAQMTPHEFIGLMKKLPGGNQNPEEALSAFSLALLNRSSEPLRSRDGHLPLEEWKRIVDMGAKGQFGPAETPAFKNAAAALSQLKRADLRIHPEPVGPSASALPGADRGRLQELARECGLNDAQLGEVGTLYPNLVNPNAEPSRFNLAPGYFGAFVKFAREHQLQPTETVGLLRALHQGYKSPEYALRFFAEDLMERAGVLRGDRPALRPEEWRGILESGGRGVFNENTARAFRNASGFLETVKH